MHLSRRFPVILAVVTLFAVQGAQTWAQDAAVDPDSAPSETGIAGDANADVLQPGSGAPASISNRMAPTDEEAAAGPPPDPAYGAYQRGYYLTAFQLALPRAQMGDPAAQTLIAELYDKGLGIPRDGKEATQWFGIAAKSGDTEAQFAYAVKLLEGRYVKADPEEARRLMKVAADHGHPTAAYNYGQMVLDRRPTTEGAREALKYFELAAEKELPDAYFALAQLYEAGIVSGYPEIGKAHSWLLKAAQAGIDNAQVELAIWLLNGKGTEKDPKQAFQWMRQAAMRGNVVAQSRLARMFAEGIGVQRDRIEAAKWHIVARRAGLTDAWLDEFLVGLPKKDFSTALSRANSWRGS
ncbi:MAG: sel1 repeat family protein [Nitratireductor sp.]|nr:sel1 repeat family protein [Nitratireductor sp.]